MSGRLLEGEVLGPEVDPEIESLRAEVRRAQRAVMDAKTEAIRAREDADRALGMLRRQLSPLYRALQAVFGELDAAGVTEAATGSPVAAGVAPSPPGLDPRKAAVWEAWKERMGAAGAIIDALLLHGDMNTTQLAIAIRRSKKTIPALIYKLHQAGLINKNGGRFSLKQL